MKDTPKFVLASASTARRQLLLNAGIVPIVQPSQFDESAVVESDPSALVKKLALGKAEVVAQQYIAEYASLGERTMADPGVIILGCDSVLVMSGRIYGKPQDETEAIARWQSMRGQTGELMTGHALIRIQPSLEPDKLVRHQSTVVEFADIRDSEIKAYIATGEPMQCAGCFTLEGRGSAFVETINGCCSNVLGLSMPLLRQMLAAMGYELTTFWAS
ncbi:MAG: septum formation inhibitor Maf [Cyanothece sp. SIO2G6]|nr:septum formation inhibitor Maf [Cyanothece sp. SIO2G6]